MTRSPTPPQLELDPQPSQLPGQGRLLIAFSGGADSTALAHLVARCSASRDVHCIHIDHGLDPDSTARAREARRIAESLDLTFQLETVSVEDGASPEAAARHARYTVLEQAMERGDCLLTAHHADDQVETILLRLLRGAGPRGLAGIPRLRRFGRDWLARPMLHWKRRDMQSHCRSHGLAWIEDPSNEHLSADRNYLRHVVLPQLRQRWPGLDQSILRSGELALQAADLIESDADNNLTSCQAGPDRLIWSALEATSLFQRAEVVRHWCRKRTGSTPPGKQLLAFLDQLEKAGQDQLPELQWRRGMLHFWNGQLWLDRAGPFSQYEFDWHSEKTLQLPPGLGALEIIGKPHIAYPLLRVRSGGLGERIRLAPRADRQRVKELMRKAKIPPWQRQQWPRLYEGDRLVAVGDRWVDSTFARCLEKQGLKLRWRAVESSLD